MPRFLPSHFRSLGARTIEVVFTNDVLVNSAGSILHITHRCLGHKSCETTQRYISIKYLGAMPTKIGCVSHVDQADMTDGSFAVKLYADCDSNKRKRRRKRGGRKHKRRRLISIHCAEIKCRNLRLFFRFLNDDDCFNYLGLVFFPKISTSNDLFQDGRIGRVPSCINVSVQR